MVAAVARRGPAARRIAKQAKALARRMLDDARGARMPKPATVDFETYGIEGRPGYPPKPVGVSIKYPGGRARYYAFGHVGCSHCGRSGGNNCTEAQAKAALKRAYAWRGGLLFQNAKFDLDVAETHWGMRPPRWQLVHDTMFLIFLDDPNQQTFSLKPAAERLLHMKPEEKDAVGGWLLEHQPKVPECFCKDCDAKRAKGDPHPAVRISASTASAHYFMRYVAFAPGDLVGPYADGDVIRTERLFKLLWPKTKRRGMLRAYDRERELLPCLLDMERQGVPVSERRLRADVASYSRWAHTVDDWLRRTLKVGEEVNLDSGEQLFDAMLKAKKVDRKKAPLTATGKFQTNKEALLLSVKDPQLLAVLKYRAQLKTCLGTFMKPWLRTAEASTAAGLVSREMRAQGKSLIYTSWNQVKGDARGGSIGARTGRLSSTPNFQNLPKEFAAIFHHELTKEERARRRKEGKRPLASCPIRGLPPLPLVRSYVVPYPGEVLIDRDYSQQEPRILAHFDGGSLLQRYLAEPWIDFHDYARQELEKAGLYYDRRPVKNTNLGLIYGMGIPALAERNDMEVQEAKTLKAAIMRLYPGLKAMYAECKMRAAQGLPVRTWGGREYYCEPPRVVEGRFRTFDYKLVNVLIQGSAADCTKEAIIRLYRTKPARMRVFFNVHDQLTASTPRAHAVADMELIRVAMESVEFDVPMLTEGSMTDRCLSELEDTDKKGKEQPALRRFAPPRRAARDTNRSKRKAVA